MKKSAALLLVLLILGGTLHAGGQVRLTGLGSMDYMNDDDVAWWGWDGSQVMHGLGWEVLFGGALGMGSDMTILFREAEGREHSFSWDGNLYLSYHLFGPRCGLDPFVLGGFGNAGTVLYETGETALTLYPFFGGGVNLLVGTNLIIGGRLYYIPYGRPVPGSGLPESPLGTYRAMISIGVALGDTR